MLPSPASQKSALTSWYDDWFETQSIHEQRGWDWQAEERQTDDQGPQAHEQGPHFSEPRSFFEDDSDDEEIAYQSSTPSHSQSNSICQQQDANESDAESSYSSIIPDCSNSDSDSDSAEDEDEDEDEDATLTVGTRVTCRRASCRVFSASGSSSEDLVPDDSESRNSTLRTRRAFELDRSFSTDLQC